MTTSEELIASIAASAKTMVDNGISGFRQNDSQVSMINGTQYAALLKAMSDQDVQSAIDASSGTTIRKFRPICG